MSGSRQEHPGQLPEVGIEAATREIFAAPGRRLPIPGTMNFRDVGGYPVGGGVRTRWRTLLRSDSLHRTDGQAAAALAALKLRTVLDLRTSIEALLAPSPMDDFAARGTTTRHISILGEKLDGIPSDLAGIYELVIAERGAAIGAAVAELARPGALPGLVHCSAGKDRTGIVIAFTLAAVGVPDDVIAADYALTARYLDPERTPAIGRLRESTGMGEKLTDGLMGSPPELILAAMDQARRQGGSVAGYLVRHGVTEAALADLRRALTGPAAEVEAGEPGAAELP